MHYVYYLKGAIKNVDDIISKNHGVCIKQYGNGKRPYPQDYMPELDIMNELDAYGISRYHKFIGMLRWEIELGCIDINTEVIFSLQYLLSP